MGKSVILLQIQEAIRLCREAGREPVALLINPNASDKLSDELDDCQAGIITFNKLFGLTVFENPKVKDFYLVDNRSWAEQKW